MKMEANAVKNAAASGTRIRGVHLTFAAPAIIEVLASVDLQFVYIDGEHGCFDWRDVEAACIAAERHDLTPIARVPDVSSATITRFLDRGVRGIVAPHVESLDVARRLIDATYFAPLGNRSFGAGRPEYGQRIGDRPAYMRDCNERVSLCLMIESGAGLDIAGDLAALPCVDYLSFGLLDLAQSLGHPGDSAHAAVKAAVADATKRIHAAGKRVREDFMSYVWINDVLVAGAKQLLGAPR
ncbi:MAG: aldolase/citrate lyase family protein [Casimicrobiaceae bacterium]